MDDSESLQTPFQIYPLRKRRGMKNKTMNQLITTSDGSHTIFVPEIDEHYHSIHGAVQESEMVYIENGYEYCKADPLNIFEVGFGTGLNVVLTLMQSIIDNRTVNYTSIEKYPVPENIIRSLNHYLYAGSNGREIFDSVQSARWNISERINTKFTLLKLKGDFTVDPIDGKFDLIYFDSFGPGKQPEMWTLDIFNKIAEMTVKNGTLVTYSAKGEIKRILRACGFDVSLLPGPPGKRQMIRAIKF
jgi:tRNA U34 5-methylaminomethyl-2-thiouridine-forming methyltransferase MnmC